MELLNDIDALTKKFEKLQTEDTGKMFEMAICMAYEIPYDGVYKYSMEKPKELAPRLAPLTELFPLCSHTARKGARYDFTALADETLHLSAKTTKKGVGKVAPQVIGQCQPQKFCDLLNIEYNDTVSLKKHIQENISTILPACADYTFDCPNIFYNEKENSIQYITCDKEKPIQWDAYDYTWSRPWDKWANSAIVKITPKQSLKTKPIPLMEFQFHSKNRTNMAVRWFYGNALKVFKDALKIRFL